MMVTVAPAITLFVESVTVPSIAVLEVCASAAAGQRQSRTIALTRDMAFSLLGAGFVCLSQRLSRSRRIHALKLRRREILLRCLLPLDHADAGGIVNNAPGADREPVLELYIADKFRAPAIGVAEPALAQLEYGDIGVTRYRQRSQFGPPNLL